MRTRTGSRRQSLWGALLVAATLLWTPAFAQQSGLSRTPIPLDNPPPMLPVETGGTGIAPEVSVRVSIDARGVVSEVEVRSIRPSSEFDDLIAEEVRDQLGRWRYAPKLENGQPVSTQLEWTVLLVPRSARPRGLSGQGASLETGQHASANAEIWSRLQAMTERQRLKVLDQAISVGMPHLGENPQKAIGESFAVWADATSEQIAALLAQNLDATFSTLIDMFGGIVELQPLQYKIVAFIYSTREEFDAFRSKVMNVESVAGFYNPAGLIAFHRERRSDRAVISTLIHEATHAFVDRYLVRERVQLPIWLSEGFASYIGNSRVKKGKLIPGKTPAAETILLDEGVLRMEAQEKIDIAETKRALKKGTALSLREIVDAGGDQYYGERISEFYTMGWLLVHYLRDGEPGWAEKEFPLFMLYVSEGYPAADSFRAVYGRDLDEMDAGFTTYIREF